MELRYHAVTITVRNRETAYIKVNDLLHKHANKIVLRVGHPIPEINTSVIFLIVKMTTDEIGAFSGKIGQIINVNVKSISLKIEEQ